MGQMTKDNERLFKELQKKRKKQNEAFDFSMKGMIRGTEDIYPESAHFIYELLQNADDCNATEASFILSKSNLIFQHNGTEHFSITEEELKFCNEILKENVFQGAVTDLGFDFLNLKVNSEDARLFFEEALSYAETVFCEDNWEEIRNYIDENKEKILAENLPETTILQIDKNGK